MVKGLRIAEAFEKTVRKFPDKPMVIFRQAVFTFREMDRLSRNLAAGLAASGVRAGDRVSVGLPNGPEIVMAFLALAKLGAVAVPLNPMLKEKELGFIFKNCPIKAAITFDAHLEILERLHLQGLQLVVLGEGLPGKALSLPKMLEDRADTFIPTKGGSEDLFLIVYTSGTTGEPKGVMLSHGNVLSVIRSLSEFQKRSEKDRGVCFFPLTHITGIVNFIVDSLAIGATIIVQERFEVEDFLENFSRYQCTVLGAVNPVFQAILNSPKLDTSDFSALRLITSGGASLPVELYQRLKNRFKVPILEMYGMTENAATLTSNPLEKQKEGSVGVALPGMDVAVVDEEGRPLPAGEIGEVLARGPGIMKGYYNQPERTRKALAGGWYHTGDLGRLDRDRFLYIVDRKDDMINAGAFKIYPRDVEEVLYSHPKVRDCAVTGRPDERLGQVPVAFIVAEPGEEPSLEALRDFCRERIANYKVPRHFYFVSELPRTAQGKVMKRFLKQRN
jgi:long-chain acyl-CoA synthetase